MTKEIRAINKTSPEKLLFKAIKSFTLKIRDIEHADSIHDVMAFYSSDLIDRINRFDELENDIAFIQFLLASENEDLVNAIQIDLFVNLFTETKNRTNLNSFIKLDQAIKDKFLESIIEYCKV